MSSFSRGFGQQFLVVVRHQAAPCRCAPTTQPTHHRLLFRLSRSQFPPSRLLQTAARAKPTMKASSSVPKATPKNATATATPLPSRVASYAEQLAAKGRVVLYEAPSHFWFRFSSISASVFCISYTVYQYWSIYLHPPPGLAWWVPHAFGVVCLFMTGMGGYFMLGTSRIVRSLESVSVKSALAQSKGKLPRGLSAAAQNSSPIYLELQTQRMMPFMPRKKVNVWPDQLQLPFRMADAVAARETGVMGAKPVDARTRLRALEAERETKRKEREYTMNHLMTAPFRDGKKAMGVMWAGIARAFSREGFAKVKVKGENYKLDTTGGWALDNGRALDRVLGAKAGPVR